MIDNLSHSFNRLSMRCIDNEAQQMLTLHYLPQTYQFPKECKRIPKIIPNPIHHQKDGNVLKL
jgi:hypothetical protein